MQLTHNTEYQAVYAARASVIKGPLRVSAVAREGTSDERRATSREGIQPPTSSLIAHRSDLLPSRIGLSVPGRVGTNVKRNRIKRRIREAFRLNREKMPEGLDFVIGVHPHEEKTVAEYAALLLAAAEALARKGQMAKG